jgi:hypothetical protein
MKLLRELLEQTMPPAKSAEDLLASIKNGKFTLDGSDLKVDSDFICRSNKLTSLTGAPTSVTGNFDCGGNKLTSLTGAPTTVTGNFYCYYNELTSLTGAPTTLTSNFYCQGNELTSLTGAPTSVTGNFYCSGNKLTSLKDVHKQIKSIGGTFYLIKNPLKSHVLGLLKIKGCKKVELDNKEAEKIINKYLPEGDLFNCQEELIEAGLDEYAQL